MLKLTSLFEKMVVDSFNMKARVHEEVFTSRTTADLCSLFSIRIEHFSAIEKTGRKPYCIREQIIGIVMASERDFDNVTCVWCCNLYAL